MNRLYFLLSFGYTSAVLAQPPRVLSLQQALTEARQNSPILRAEQLNVGISQADVVTAGLKPNPVLNNQSLQLMKPSRFAEGTGLFNNQNRQVWWQLTSPTNINKQRQKAVALAEQSVELTRRNYAETERNLLFTVASQWLDAWSTQRNLSLIAEAQRTLDTLVDINRVRLRNQVITQTDLLRTQVLADQYRLRGQTVRLAYLAQLAGLKRLLGTPDSLDVGMNEAASYWHPAPLDSLLSTVTSTRTDIQVADQAIEVANRNRVLQEALRTPRPELGAIYNPQNGVPYIGFFGTMPLPFFNRNQGEIQKAKVIQLQTQQVATYTRTFVQSEVQTAYRAYQTQQSNLNRYAQIELQADQVLASVRYAYLKGGTSIVDLLEAQRSWLDVQQEYLNTQTEYRRALIQLLYATGQLREIAK